MGNDNSFEEKYPMNRNLLLHEDLWDNIKHSLVIHYVDLDNQIDYYKCNFCGDIKAYSYLSTGMDKSHFYKCKKIKEALNKHNNIVLGRI
jgi:hypothetical protein